MIPVSSCAGGGSATPAAYPGRHAGRLRSVTSVDWPSNPALGSPRVRRWFAAAGVLVGMLACSAAAQAEIPAALKSSCQVRTAAPGYTFERCDDGNTTTFGRTPNVGGVRGIRVPAKYDGFEGLPPKAADATSV